MNAYSVTLSTGRTITVVAPTLGQALALASRSSGFPASSWKLLPRERSHRWALRLIVAALALAVGLAVYLVGQL